MRRLIEKFTGAEIQSQLLPDYCPNIYGVDLAAHCGQPSN